MLVVPVFAALWAMVWIDEMKLSSIAPLVVAVGLLVSFAFQRMKDLTLPLWLGK